MRQQPDCEPPSERPEEPSRAEEAPSASAEALQPAQQQQTQPLTQPQVQVQPQVSQQTTVKQQTPLAVTQERRKASQVQPAARKRRKSLEQQQQPSLRRPKLAAGESGGQQVVGGAQGESQATCAKRPAGDNICAACLKPIRERYLLMALDKQWHEDCLKCACCDCRLGEVGSSLFTHSDKILCRRDFLRIFGQHGHCAACKKSIPPYEMVMRANDNAYHMDCFACQQCQYRFCVGDRFHLSDRLRIVCVLCHSEQPKLGQEEPSKPKQQQQQQHSQLGPNQEPVAM